MDPRIAAAAQVIEDRMGERLTVPLLAREFNLSPSRFAHVFRHHFGVAPMRYLHTRRMLRARDLLETTFLSVKEIMVLVGCVDASHFTRHFRRQHGVTPTEVRAAKANAREETREEQAV
jgi:transcriptional regulator GlxA family with amidase domain